MMRRSRFTNVVGFEHMNPKKGSRWRTIWDINFKNNDIPTTGNLLMNQGSLTTLDGLQYHLRVMNASTTNWTVTADTGIVVDFAASSNGSNRLEMKIPYMPTLADGHIPRLRLSAAFSDLTTSHNNDYIAAGIGSYWRNNGIPTNPAVWAVYDHVNTTPTYKWLARAVKGTLGDSSPSGVTTGSGANDSTSADSGVIVLEDSGQGVFLTRGHSGNTNIITGSSSKDQWYAGVSALGSNGLTNSQQQIFWRSNSSYDGPYAVLRTNNGNNSSQTVTWERVVVEAFL
jgi:hypothetical protein